MKRPRGFNKVVLALHRKKPDANCYELAAELGVDRSYVYATLKRAGIKPPPKRIWTRPGTRAIPTGYRCACGNTDRLERVS